MIFLLSNRGYEQIAFWPFGPMLAMPLGAVVLVALLLGIFLGMLLHLPHRFAVTRRAKKAEKRVAELEAKQTP